MNDYYKTCAFPKPGNTRKKKKTNGYKEKAERRCYYTGIPNAERHELFYGSGTRQISVDHCLQVDLHPLIHKLFHGESVPAEMLEPLGVSGMFPHPLAWAADEQHRLRKEAQEKWELNIRVEMGLSAAAARRAWLELIRGSCLD